MPSLPKAGSLKDPQVAALFSTDDPERVFTDLREIGHGSFGAVYYARNVHSREVVAIKKMSYSGRQASEKWQDIIKEVTFLRQVKHKNCIEYKGCYLREHTAWLVMEYCLGSASDIIEVHKKPLRENEIGAICKDALQGLDYLHAMNRIHRDVKAGNILLTDSGTVKLADFGSASINCPANSFVGTPYWMAPEVILAMDEGQYDGNVDIWSLGITCIELAERKPPLFNMNAMSALYHIAQNDSPSLSGGEWSDDFRNFVDTCLEKDPRKRPNASQSLKHIFIQDDRPNNIVQELILRTKRAVSELDNLQYKRAKKIFILNPSFDQPDDNSVGSDGGSNGPTPTPEPIVEDDNSTDNASSKSNSVASQQSLQSLQSIPSSEISMSSMNSIPGPSQPEDVEPDQSSVSSFHRPRRSSSGSVGREPGAMNFATIRTTSIVTQEAQEHVQENVMREQMSGYKRMRRTHQKQLQQMENKFKQEMDDHKQKLDREYEALMQNFQRELEKLRTKHNAELDKKNRLAASGEKKKIKELTSANEKDMKLFIQSQKKHYQHSKEEMRKSFNDTTPRKVKDETMKNHKESLHSKQQSEEASLQATQKLNHDHEIRKYRRRKLLQYHESDEKLLQEELNKRQAQLDYAHAMLLRHHESTQDLEYKHLAAIHRLRDDQMKKQHSTEKENQKEYNQRAERELKQKHALELRNQPKSLKQRELQIRRQFHDAMKVQQKQYKMHKEQLLLTTPKSEQKELVKKLKDDRMRRMARLGQEYESSIADMMQQQSLRLNDAQKEELKDLKMRLDQELELLIAYQSKLRFQLEAQHQRERKQLEERVSLRRALLEQKMEEENHKFCAERLERRRNYQERQDRELQEFDLQTTTMGLDNGHIVECTQHSYQDEDQDSVRGSVLSLTASSSSSSFATGSSQTAL